jgi:REP-associated tyrosine transposase
MRKNRSTTSGTIYHVISRFVGRQWFINSDEERRGYLSALGLHLAQTDWRCFAYAIMSNHIHLALLAGAMSLASWIRRPHNEFAQWINERSDRIGAVFVRGPNLVTVLPEGAARLIGYIHCNPVRAGLASQPAGSTWTSHRAYLGLTHRPPWLDVDLGLELAGFRTADTFDTWIRDAQLDRSALDAVCVKPPSRPRGRPREEHLPGADWCAATSA